MYFKVGHSHSHSLSHNVRLSTILLIRICNICILRLGMLQIRAALAGWSMASVMALATLLGWCRICRWLIGGPLLLENCRFIVLGEIFIADVVCGGGWLTLPNFFNVIFFAKLQFEFPKFSWRPLSFVFNSDLRQFCSILIAGWSFNFDCRLIFLITGSLRSYLWCIEFSRVESRESATACSRLRLIQGEWAIEHDRDCDEKGGPGMLARLMRKMSMLVKMMRGVSMLVMLMNWACMWWGWVSMIVEKWSPLFISAVHDLPQTINNISWKVLDQKKICFQGQPARNPSLWKAERLV